MTLAGSEIPERLSVALQTSGNDHTLKVRPALGRAFTAEEEHRGVDSGVALTDPDAVRSPSKPHVRRDLAPLVPQSHRGLLINHQRLDELMRHARPRDVDPHGQHARRAALQIDHVL